MAAHGRPGPVPFHTPGDGLSLEIDQPHGLYDMDEYGHSTVEDDLPDFPMGRLIGQRILPVREIRYQHGDYDLEPDLGAEAASAGI